MKNIKSETICFEKHLVNTKKIKIYTDGSCINNPGPGGWAFYAVLYNYEQNLISIKCKNCNLKSNCGNCILIGGVPSNIVSYEEYFGEIFTTNNRMELISCIKALEFLKTLKLNLDTSIDIMTDSNYVQQGISKWILDWKRNGRLSLESKNPVKNIDLWTRLDYLKNKTTNLNFIWIRSHESIKLSDSKEIIENKLGNRRADYLAKLGSSSLGK